jgi:NAD(P)-dependent dehydrogenase (short-subunit alcohol dehydrogenase family)
MSASGTVLVTGAAGAIGSATSALFLARGADVLGVDRKESTVHDDRYRHLVLDLADGEASESEIGRALAELPPLTHVVGIAGGALPDEPSTQDEPRAIGADLFRMSLEANLVTQFILVRATIEALGTAGEPDHSITFCSSFNALSAQGMPAYSAAKAGIIGLMHGLVRPLGRRGIRVNVVAPGTVRTPRTERIWAGTPGHFERLESGTASRRLAEPTDVASAFAALALDLRHVTGHVLVVDGGQLAIHA